MRPYWILFLLLIPLAVAFDYQVGEQKEVHFYCVNATDGKPLGTAAKLKVRNDSGVFYVVDALENVEVGLFKHNITNLTRNHCYSFMLNCTADGAFNVEWGTVCTETNMTTSGVSNFASIGGLVVGSGVFLWISQYFVHIPVLTYSLILLSQVFMAAALYLGLKWAEMVQAAAAVTSIMGFAFYMIVVLLGLGFVALFWYAVVNSLTALFPKKMLKGKVLK